MRLIRLLSASVGPLLIFAMWLLHSLSNHQRIVRPSFGSDHVRACDTYVALNGPIRTPSLEVVNVAGDSAVGRDRIQSAPNLRRVHVESA
jgi:hypothetical protein